MIENLLQDLLAEINQLESVREQFEDGSLTLVEFKLFCQVCKRVKCNLERANRLFESMKNVWDHSGEPD